MQVAPFLQRPTQSSRFWAHVGPPQPSWQAHWNEPGRLRHDSALMHGPRPPDAAFDSHSSTSAGKKKNIVQRIVSAVNGTRVGLATHLSDRSPRSTGAGTRSETCRPCRCRFPRSGTDLPRTRQCLEIWQKNTTSLVWHFLLHQAAQWRRHAARISN